MPRLQGRPPYSIMKAWLLAAIFFGIIGLMAPRTGLELLAKDEMNLLGLCTLAMSAAAWLIANVYFARSKGYSATWGLLGLLGFVGLIAIWMLPEKEEVTEAEKEKEE